MSLTKFTENVNVIQGLDDKPAKTASALKEDFDTAVGLIKTFINDTLTAEIDAKVSELTTKINSIYPVGAIYMSVNNTNPGTLFGGTWVAWGSGKVPVGVNTSETEFNTVEKTGGAKTHTLTTQQMPSHGHSVSITSSGTCTTGSDGSHVHPIQPLRYVASVGSGTPVLKQMSSGGTETTGMGAAGSHTHTVPNHTHTVSQSNAGGGQAHNNLQPYITCYMWKRTA